MKYLMYLILILNLFTFSSCSKKCELPDNEYNGIIVKDVILKSTSVKTAMDVGEGVIVRTQDENEEYGNCTMSIDGGDTYGAIDFGTYSLVGVKTETSCASTFKREVEKDDIGNFVNYSITFNTCEEGCNFNVQLYNWVLIPAVDNSYEIEVFLF